MSTRSETPLIGCCTRCAQLFDDCRCPEGDRRRVKWTAPSGDGNDRGRKFLERFIPRRRAFVAPQFYAAVRSGISDPEAVCDAVARSMRARLTAAYDSDERAKVTDLLDALRMFGEEA